jgi:hypothetical protein
MKDYGKLEDLGLDHYSISEELADWDILERNWKSAEPLALEAAQAYSGSGLLSASRVYEGKRDTKKAEYFAAECARSYPSSAGTTWYFLCRRLGTGDKDAARAMAEQNIKREDADPSWYPSQRAGAFYLLEGDPKNALRRLDMSKVPDEDPWAAIWRLGMTVVAADELKDKDRRAQSIAEMRQVVTKLKDTDARSSAVLTQLCNAFEGTKFKAEDLSTIATSINYWDGSSKNYFQYYFGAALDEQGDKENAALCWRRAAFLDPFNAEAATLAGAQLVKRYGPDRGNLPQEYADQEAKVAKENSEDKAADTKVEK